MSDHFNEFANDVQKELRQENFKQLWKKYGKHITFFLILFFGSVTFYFLWEKNNQYEIELSSTHFLKAQSLLSAGQTTDAIQSLKSLSKKTDKSSYSFFGKVHLADQSRKKALGILSELIQTTPDILLKDFARILYGNIAIEQKIPTKNIQEILIPAEKGPWKVFAWNLLGFLHYTHKEYKKAENYFLQILKYPNAPQDFKIRAEIFYKTCLSSQE